MIGSETDWWGRVVAMHKLRAHRQCWPEDLIRTPHWRLLGVDSEREILISLGRSPDDCRVRMRYALAVYEGFEVRRMRITLDAYSRQSGRWYTVFLAKPIDKPLR